MIGKRAAREDDVAWGPSGLGPGVVQDAADGRVLMVAYVDAEALAATLATGEVHFHSRSRDRLWRKGETSGNVLRLLDIAIDCDGDACCSRWTRPARRATETRAAASIRPRPCGRRRGRHGPRRPRAATPLPGQGFEWLETLWATIDSRHGRSGRFLHRPAAGRRRGRACPQGRRGSDRSSHGRQGRRHSRRLASAATRDALAGEVADLLYHTLALLRERDLPPSAVIARLRERHKA
jgi:phosphoribosyl-ATP pyrophosphohydrolase/phosphoribosyl-AMP cyclohydrolase